MRGKRGRFLAGDPETRECGWRGFEALVESQYGGNRKAAIDRLVAMGKWAIDHHYSPENRVFHHPDAEVIPGPSPYVVALTKGWKG